MPPKSLIAAICTNYQIRPAPRGIPVRRRQFDSAPVATYHDGTGRTCSERCERNA
jgi:hypothetical protein